MSEYLIQSETLTGIADAIRGKTGGTDPVAVSDMAAAIRAIQAGGSTPAAPVGQKDVNFYDYDGTLVESYTLEEAQALNVLPNGPAHDGLVFRGWNWSLEDIKAMTRPVNVGAMYITDDGKTRLHIRVWDKARSNVPLYFSQTIASGVTIDWGDGSAAETLAGTGNVNTAHQYAAAGDYTISLAVVDGCTLGLGHTSYSYCIMGSTGNPGRVYCNLLQAVNIGVNVTSIGNYAFASCSALASITIPDGVTSIGSYAFESCFSLASITIPDGVTSIGDGAFASCFSLASITIPDGVTSIGNDAFQNCYGIAEYHLKPTTPPTLANTNAFINIPSDCIIYVPKGSLEDYQAATNWATYANYMREEDAAV